MPNDGSAHSYTTQLGPWNESAKLNDQRMRTHPLTGFEPNPEVASFFFSCLERRSWGLGTSLCMWTTNVCARIYCLILNRNRKELSYFFGFSSLERLSWGLGTSLRMWTTNVWAHIYWSSFFLVQFFVFVSPRFGRGNESAHKNNQRMSTHILISFEPEPEVASSFFRFSSLDCLRLGLRFSLCMWTIKACVD